MMVGSRFSVGAPAPQSVPADLVQRMREVERSLSDQERASKRWTLTWLEGRPVVTLDDGPSLRG